MKLRLSEHGVVTDRFGNETAISVLTADGKPVAVIHSQDRADRYSDDAIHHEHVIQGIEVYYSAETHWRDTLLDSSCPSRSRMRMRVESKDARLPGDVDVANAVRADYDYWEGYNFLLYGEKGAEVPTDASEAYMEGLKAAKKKSSRIIRKGKLTGAGRSY